MVDSRQKGTRAEYQVRDTLRTHTGQQWERVPGSGGFVATHGLKGDIYIPETKNKYCIEVKHYKEDVINCNMFNPTVSQFEKFWQQTRRESDEIKREPLLIFKKDRGKWLIATIDSELIDIEMTFLSPEIEEVLYIYLFSEWLQHKTAEDFVR